MFDDAKIRDKTSLFIEKNTQMLFCGTELRNRGIEDFIIHNYFVFLCDNFSNL